MPASLAPTPPALSPDGDRQRGVAFVDPSLAVVAVDAALAALVGRPADELRGRPLAEAMPGWAATLAPLVAQVAATGAPALGVVLPPEWPARDGARAPCVASCYPVRSRGGHVAGVDLEIAAAGAGEGPRDEVPWEAVAAGLDIMPVGLVLLGGADLRVRWANAVYQTFLDAPFQRGSLVGRRLHEFIPRAEESGVAAIFRQVAATGRPYTNPEFRHDGFARGATFWRWTLLPVVRPGAPVDLLLVVSEVTEQVGLRQEAEALARALHAERAQLAALVEQLPVGLYVAEAPSGRLLLHNAEAVRLLGHPLMPTEDMGGYAQYGALHPDGRPFAPEDHPLARAIQGETIRAERLTYRRGDGALTRIEVSAAPIRAVDGRVALAVSTFHAVDERERAEERLRRLQGVTARFAAAQTRAEVRQVILGEILGALDADRVALRLVTPEGLALDGEPLAPSAGAGPGRPDGLAPPGAPHPAADAARRAEALFFPDRAALAAVYPGLAGPGPEHGPQASAQLPLRRGDEVFGVLSVGFGATRAWDEGERAFALALASRVAGAYERARLFEAERQARQRAERLQAVTAALGSATSPREVYDAVLRNGLAPAGAAKGEDLVARSSTLYVLAGDALELAGWGGFEPALIEQYRRIPLAAPIPIADAVRARRPVWLSSRPDYASRYPHLREQIERLVTEAAVSMPLEFERRLLGALTFTFAEPRAFSPDERRFLLALADQAAQALERSRLFHSLRESEERFRSLFDSIDEGFCIVELIFDEAGRPADCRYLLANPAFERLTGLHGAVGRTARELVPDLEAFWLERYAQVALTGAPARFEGGSEALASWYEVYASRVGDGSVGRVAIVFTDITERKLAEQALRASEAQQAALAREQQQLYEEEQRARAAAEAAVRLREEFLSIASHELRTPLTSVIAHAQTFQRRALRDGALGERDRRSLEQILTHAGRLNRMIETMLDVGRIDHGRLQVERAPLDLAALVREVVASLDGLWPRHSIVVAGADAPRWVSGDALRLEQVLHNLLGNAIKYSPRGGPVDVTLSADAAAVQIVIGDRGIGIPARDVPRIFERFYRAGNVSADTITGVGIGLFVVREIVTLHGGTIAVASAEGAGSRFTITLPLIAPP